MRLMSLVLLAACGAQPSVVPAGAVPTDTSDDPAVAPRPQDLTTPSGSRVHGGDPAVVLDGETVEDQLDAALRQLAPQLGLRRADLDRLRRVHVQHLPPGGAIGLWDGVVDGLVLLDARVHVLVDRDGHLAAWSTDPNVDLGFPAVLKGPAATISPEEAVALAGEAAFGERAEDLSAAKPRHDGWLDVAQAHVTQGLVLDRPGRVREVAAARDGAFRRAWQVEVWGQPDPEVDAVLFEVVIDAADGAALDLRSLTLDAAFDYRVWAEGTGTHRPLDNPEAEDSPTIHATPTDAPSVYVPSAMVTMEGFNTNPSGVADPWLPDSATTTHGNNAFAYTDRNANGFDASDVVPTVSSPGVFDHVFDHALDPTADVAQQMAAGVGAFYTVNWLHDAFYDAGFDEAAGVAQADNFGRGGADGDAMDVEVQDGASTNNANMTTPADGESPRMQLFLWNATEDRGVQGGSVDTTIASTANYGPQTFDVTGDLVEASPVDACTTLAPTASGHVVLANRGACTFLQKVLNVQAAGGTGLVLANNVAGVSAIFTSDPAAASVAIPVLMIRTTDGDALRADLGAGPVSLRMFRTAVYPARDAALDAEIVAHEWGHYQHFRAARCGVAQCSAFSEGWADFVAFHMVLRDGDDLDGAYPFSRYSGRSFLGASYYGIRRAPYSRDRAVNDFSLRHVVSGAPLPSHPISPTVASVPNDEVHNAGEVFAAALIDGYLGTLERGPTRGRTFEDVRSQTAQHIVAAPWLFPANATYMSARDALLATVAAFDADDADVLADAFAARGMGTCAETPSPLQFVGVVESFDRTSRTTLGTLSIDDAPFSCDADGLLDAGETLTVHLQVTNTGDEPLAGATITLSETTGYPGLAFPDGAAFALPTVPPHAATDASWTVRLPRAATTPGAIALVATLDASGDCNDGAAVGVPVTVNGDVVSGARTTDDFEADDGSWTLEGVDAATYWERTTTDDDSFSWFGHAPPATSDTRLVSPVLHPAQVAPLVFSFTHRHDFEADFALWDGGVIEISVDGGPWEDVTPYSSTSPGYTGTITDQSGNPLGLRDGYSGLNPAWPGYDTVSLNLGTQFRNHDVRLSFRMGTDAAVNRPGWEIGEVTVTGVQNGTAPFPELVADTTVCNQPPVANAGPDEAVQSHDVVVLDGSASFDPNGDALRFRWVQTAGPAVLLSGAGTAMPTFTAPGVAASSTVRFRLSVTDGDASAFDTVDVTVDPDGSPVCAVGTWQSGDTDGDGICDDADVCFLDSSFGDADADGICDLGLTVPMLRRGRAANVPIANAKPGATAWLFASFASPGPGPCAPDGTTCLGIVGPVILDSEVVAPDGTATFVVSVPASAPVGTGVALQAAWRDTGTGQAETSRVVARQVQP